MKLMPVLLVTALLISACGFRPLYGDADTLAGDSASLDSITIDEISLGGQSGLALKNGLIDRFYHHGYPQNAPYVLKVTLLETGRTIVIQKNNTTSRSQLVITANYQLVDRATRKAIDTGVIRAVGSFNVLESQYTTLVTQNNARQAAINELADKLTLRMAVVLQSGHGATPDLPPPRQQTQSELLQNHAPNQLQSIN